MSTQLPKHIRADSALRREWIKQQLRRRGSSLAQVAREHGVSRDAPILALRKPYPRMERAIAEALDLAPEAIWPERYDANGRPNRPIGRPKKSISKKAD
ncbi:Ner family transcriptional regulator [Natronospira proteinivora]|uniref:Ner family transcriptional regulator n=1 Tax=Natronospira proteinivora TaxID=1807133 RepID=A0ABT1G4N4_9GAMM|nr:helix-turn-helix domain-containing protein [Natronospira proteinivora]MCP1726254.1 Ner family transcriptional regulator [Natronospira proteinivora]